MTPKQIKIGRVKMGLNQTQFAELIGVVRTAVVAWEHGNDIPQKKNMAKLKEVLMPHLWKELTEDEVNKLWHDHCHEWEFVQKTIINPYLFAQMLSEKLKEKNI